MASDRAALVGTKIESFELRSGAAFKNAEIREVTPAGLRIVHSAGAATIDFKDLLASWQEKVHYDPNEE